MSKQGRNKLCACGSEVKYKRCCGNPLKQDAKDIIALPFAVYEKERLLDVINVEANDSDEFMAAALMAGLMEVPLSGLEKNHPKIARDIRECHPIESALSFSGLLTMPELQSNCLRLEALVYFSLMHGQGIKSPSFDKLQKWFAGLESSIYANYEDPAEDVFISLVSTPRGSYRIFEGLYEANAFHLQRVINIVEDMPDTEDFNFLRGKVEALLKISEAIINRLGIPRYTLGSLFPEKKIISSLKFKMEAAKQALCFSLEDLEELKIDPHDLEPFIFNLDNRNVFEKEGLRHSSLEKRPFVIHEGVYYLLLPTAIGATIRQFVISMLIFGGLGKNFERALVGEYKRLLQDTLIFGKLRDIPLSFVAQPAGYITSVVTEIDAGRYLQFIFFVDNINGFEKDGLNGINSVVNKTPINFKKLIGEAYTQMSKQSGFRSGISLIVGCGWGRGLSYESVDEEYTDWTIQHISAPDLLTLSWKHEFKPLTLFRITDALKAAGQSNIDIMNINGILNLYAHIDNNDGHIIPKATTRDGFGGADHPNLLMIDQSQLVGLRHEIATHWDVHFAPDEEGYLISVRKEPQSIFKEDLERPLYISDTEISQGRLRALYETDSRFWWVENIYPAGTPRGAYQIEQFKMLYNWLARAVPILERHLCSLPHGIISWKVSIAHTDVVPSEERITEDELRKSAEISVDKEKQIISLNLMVEFHKGFIHPQNIAERIIVEQFVSGILILADIKLEKNDFLSLIDYIVPDTAARHMHAFLTHSFRDYVRGALSQQPITVDYIDEGSLHLGLCWPFSERGKTSTIKGKIDCTRYLGDLVRKLENDLCLEMRKYNREQLVRKLLLNHEYAAYDKSLWRRTSKAILALHTDKEEAFKEILEHEGKLSGVFLASRVLVEAALCESPLEGGLSSGKLDVSRLISLTLCIVQLGEWSNLMHFECMEPLIKITPLGDARANTSFMDAVVRPYTLVGNKRQVVDAIDDYEDLFSEPEFMPSVHHAFPQEFLSAWNEELGFSLDEGRFFIELMEDMGIDNNEAVLRVTRSSLLAKADDKLPQSAIENILKSLSSQPRANWHTIPAGYNDADRQPWRYRRRFSLLRRPIVQLDEQADPTFLVAPGLLKESFIYTISHYRGGDFHLDHALTKKMRQWFGKIADEEGAEFNERVASKMAQMGWHVKREIKITEIFGKSHDIDYGDVDVLAWNNSGRVLLMECKDLKYSKTPREMAEQLYKFRGKVDTSGKRDTLKKHLDRINLLKNNQAVLVKYLRLKTIKKVEGHLVFSNAVPMQFAWERMNHLVSLSIFDELEKFDIKVNSDL